MPWVCPLRSGATVNISRTILPLKCTTTIHDRERCLRRLYSFFWNHGVAQFFLLVSRHDYMCGFKPIILQKVLVINSRISILIIIIFSYKCTIIVSVEFLYYPRPRNNDSDFCFSDLIFAIS